jgi:hypothetical protein
LVSIENIFWNEMGEGDADELKWMSTWITADQCEDKATHKLGVTSIQLKHWHDRRKSTTSFAMERPLEIRIIIIQLLTRFH